MTNCMKVLYITVWRSACEKRVRQCSIVTIVIIMQIYTSMETNLKKSTFQIIDCNAYVKDGSCDSTIKVRIA